MAPIVGQSEYNPEARAGSSSVQRLFRRLWAGARRPIPIF